MEISKLVPNLIRRFDFELYNPEKHWHTMNRLFVKPKDFFVRVRALDAYKQLENSQGLEGSINETAKLIET